MRRDMWWGIMRRILYAVILAAIFVPTGYFGSNAVRELAEMTEARQEREQRNRARIMRVLKADDRYIFQQVVVGPGDDGKQELDFRARAYRDGFGQAAYGAIRTDCPPPAEKAGCWELASLYVNGIPVEQHAGAPDDGGAADLAPEITAPTGIADSVAIPSGATDATEGTAAGTASFEVKPLLTPTISAATDAVPETAAAQPGLDLRPTHAVRRSLVNARDAPRGQALAQLPQGTPLFLLDRQGGWGRFQVLDGAVAGREVWIALSVLDAI